MLSRKRWLLCQTPRRMRQRARPAGLATDLISYPIASLLCVLATRMRIRPTVLTLMNLIVGVGTSAVVAASAHQIAGGRTSAVLAGLLAWLGWQFAYVCDCVDGQLSRVSGVDECRRRSS
jgi:hypothetical protein